ncbi:PIG-L family deacetylase [uncultured Brachyspira sp.]|uniref:PIG-L family deacetylase n=1 Tax=uncultured Brachyspira sp. TaxID=221953 RepID=UPI002636F72F|nr:PIG-L family deacetylase [uncultured Brachyspira sp.]
MHYIFISPHYDDICFSLGGFLHKIRNSSIKKTLINIYTISNYCENESILSEINSFSVREKINYISSLRDSEDSIFAEKYNLNKVNLGFVEAGIRNLVWNLDYIENDIKSLQEVITNLLKKIIIKDKETVIFVPMSIGCHRDHVVSNKVIKNLLNNNLLKNVIFYEDTPYITFGKNRFNFFNENKHFFKKNNNYEQLKIILNEEELKTKSTNIKIYRSQLSVDEFDNFNIKKYVLLNNNNYIESLWKKL